MALYLTYPTEVEAEQALSIVNGNMAAIAAANGYEVVDGVVLGKVDGVTDPNASGSATWAELTNVGVGYGFLDPANNPWGADVMDGVPEGVLIEYMPPEIDGE